MLAGPNPPVLLAPSRWAAQFAETAVRADRSLDKVKTGHLALGLNPEEFARLPKAESRRLLGLPPDQFLILLSGDPLDRRKGLPEAVEALRKIGDKSIGVVACGTHATPENFAWPTVYAMGFVQETHRQSLLYSAVDLFVGPNRQETLGQVFLEAAACGTPSVGYAGSGVEEAIVDGVTGILIRERGGSIGRGH